MGCILFETLCVISLDNVLIQSPLKIGGTISFPLPFCVLISLFRIIFEGSKSEAKFGDYSFQKNIQSDLSHIKNNLTKFKKKKKKKKKKKITK